LTLKNKIILFIVPIIVFPMIAGGWLSYSKFKNTVLEKYEVQTETLMKQHVLHTHQFIQSAEANIRLFANNELLRRYMATPSQQERYEILQPLLMKQILGYQKAYPQYYEFRLIFPDGFEDLRQVNRPIENLTMNEADTPFIKDVLHYTQGVFSRVQRNPDNGEQSLYVATALKLKDRSIESLSSREIFRGYLVLTIDISDIIDQLDVSKLGKHGYIFTTDNTGKAKLFPSRLGPALTGAVISPRQMSGLKITDEIINMAGETDMSALPILKTRFIGDEGYMKAAKINDDFTLVTWLPVHEITAQTNRLGLIVIGITLLAVAVTVILLFFFLDYFVLRPIQTLRNSAVDMGHGVLTGPINIRRTDEIGELAESFEEMRKSMLSSHEYLQGLVDERTAEVSKALELAKNASAEKSNYLSRMSHELRTPLNAIIGFSQLYTYDENMTGNQKINAGKIKSAGEYLLSLIDEVLDLTKIESGNIKLSLEATSLSRVIDSCCVLTENLANTHNVSIVFDRKQCEELYINADYTRIKQVILNLLSNAVKYNRDHGTVSIYCMPASDDNVRIVVQDTGPGISDTELSHLFQPFNRLGAEQSNAEGTGIGLLISKQLVELMGGRMGADSKAGIGSTFWVELKTTTKKTSASAEKPDYESAMPDRISAVSAEHARILVAEDNEVNQDVIRLQLNMLGYSADFAANGVDALGKWRSNDYHLLMTDIHMPTMDGYELVKRIHNTQQFARNRIPVIAITADAMEDQLKRCLDAGIDDYIVKPVDIENLKQVLNKWLSTRFASAPDTD